MQRAIALYVRRYEHLRHSTTSNLPRTGIGIRSASRAVGNRRLGIAIAGGLAFSIVLTPTVVPASIALLQDFSGDRRKHILGS